MIPNSILVGTFVGSPNGGGATQSTFVTFSYTNSFFDAYVPVIITNPGTTSISAGAEATLYRSTDGGVTWETQGCPGSVFPRPTAANQVQRQDVLVPTGQFLIAVQMGGGSASTWTAQMNTAFAIASY